MSTGASSSASVALANAGDAQQVEGRTAVTILQRFAVFAATFGPGSAVATYTVLFGWYQHEYHTSEILVWMRLALYAPFPLIKMLQQRYDNYFDELYGTEGTYFIRLVVMQVVVSILMVLWMCLPEYFSSASAAGNEIFHPILIFGVLLGFCCAPFIGSTIQVAVAIDPVLFVWAQLGNTSGMTMPVLASFAFRFKSASSHADLCRMLAVPLTICICTSAMLCGLHFSGVFNTAYQTINRRRSVDAGNVAASANPQDAIANPQDEDAPPAAAPAQDSQDRELIDADEELATWVLLWLAGQSSGIFLDFFLLTYIGYFGDPELTHSLASGALACAATGRVLSLAFQYLPNFDQGPMHIFSVMLYVKRVGLWMCLVLRVYQVIQIPDNVILPLWCSWILVSMLHNSLTDLTVTANVSDGKKQKVAQLSVTLCYSGLFLGLLTASTLVLADDEAGGKLGGDGGGGGVLLSTLTSPARFLAQLAALQ